MDGGSQEELGTDSCVRDDEDAAYCSTGMDAMGAAAEWWIARRVQPGEAGRSGSHSK